MGLRTVILGNSHPGLCLEPSGTEQRGQHLCLGYSLKIQAFSASIQSAIPTVFSQTRSYDAGRFIEKGGCLTLVTEIALTSEHFSFSPASCVPSFLEPGNWNYKCLAAE